MTDADRQALRDPLGAENDPASAATPQAIEPASADGQASGRPVDVEDGLPNVPDPVRSDIGAYRLWGLIALAVLIFVLLIAMY